MKWKMYGRFLIAMGALTSCGGADTSSQQKPPPPAAVNVYTVQQGSSRYNDQYPGTVTAINQVDIRAQISGYINGIFFTDGQWVNKGDKLYSIDPQQYRGAYEQSVASLNVAEANLARSQQDADRYQELSNQDAIAKQVLDHAIADLEASKRQVEAAKANVKIVETNLRYATIYAPFSGTIGISQVKLGAAVSPGQTVLNTISSDDPIAVDFAVDQKNIPWFLKLAADKTELKDSVFTLLLSDLTIYPGTGKIFLIDRAVDPQSGTIKTRLLFNNAKKNLRVGMTCNVLVRNNTNQQSILIPYRAVVEQMGEYFVFTVTGNKVAQQKIVLGAKISDKVIVKEGLKVGQQIVTDGVQKIRDGAMVQVGIP
jgi:RND family efflux transporter MFP subunit